MGLQVTYLQTVFCLGDLEQITLAEELPGSDNWPIRDLFQRDIDHHRVQNQILPWLRDGQRIKFLPPIVLALIPRSSESDRVLQDIPRCETGAQTSVPGKISLANVPSLYEFTASDPRSVVGQLVWNPARCWMVALDGQHRIASLRAWTRANSNDAPRDWTVPAIVLAATNRALPTSRPPTQLDFARSVFVYINTQGRTPSPARKILLDDADPHAIIAQELVERAQARGLASQDELRPSIALFAWRDSDSKFAADCHRLFDIEEVYGWVAQLLLPQANSHSEVTRRLLGTESQTIAQWLHQRHVPISGSAEFRSLVGRSIVPCLELLCTMCLPYRAYVSRLNVEIRRICASATADTAALRLLASGGSRANTSAKAQAEAAEAATRLQSARRALPMHFRESIGMRSVVSGLHTAIGFDDFSPSPEGVVEFTTRYIHSLNDKFAAGWLTDDEHECPNKYLRHITRSHDGKVKNYRFEDIGTAGGALCALLTSNDLFKARPRVVADVVQSVGRRQLFQTVQQGYVSELKSVIKKKRPEITPAQLRAEAQTKSLALAHSQLDYLLAEAGVSNQ